VSTQKVKHMNLKTTKRLTKGFALPGLLLNLSFGSLLLFSASSALHPRQWMNQIAISHTLTQQDREASDVLSQEIRGASSVQRATARQIVLSNRHGNVSYTYDAAARTLTRAEGVNSEILLKGLDSFSFSLFRRPGAQDAFNAFTPSTAENAKLVACRWSCSQRIAGAKLDSDSFQMSPTLLRGR